jgi:hypothetical protein
MQAPTYGYTGIRTTLPVLAGKDSKGTAHVFTNVPVILNHVNGSPRSVTVLSDSTNTGKAVARLTSAITF